MIRGYSLPASRPLTHEYSTDLTHTHGCIYTVTTVGLYPHPPTVSQSLSLALFYTHTRTYSYAYLSQLPTCSSPTNPLSQATSLLLTFLHTHTHTLPLLSAFLHLTHQPWQPSVSFLPSLLTTRHLRHYAPPPSHAKHV